MRVFENQKFDRFYDRNSGAVFCDLEFRRCEFANCSVSLTYDPRLRSTVRNVRMVRCSASWSDPGAAIVEDVLIDGLATDRLLQTWGAVFKHVTLAGKIGRVMVSSILCPIKDATPSRQRAFAEANAAYYADVDWALDISRAEFHECTIRGIPARLIRRDPETQVVVTRASAVQGRWRNLDLSGTHWATSLDLLLTDNTRQNDADVVLVVPKRSSHFRRLLEGIELLRKSGVAEPD